VATTTAFAIICAVSNSLMPRRPAVSDGVGNDVPLRRRLRARAATGGARIIAPCAQGRRTALR